MLGNTLILKPSPTTPQCGLICDKLMWEAGFNNHEFQTIFIDVPQVETVMADKRIAGVSLTGSVRAGKSIGEVAGKNIKRCVLELGGSDPFIVTKEADLNLVILQL